MKKLRRKTYRVRYLNTVKPMPTLIIGMYYDRGKGAAIISDSRLQIGTDYYTVHSTAKDH